MIIPDNENERREYLKWVLDTCLLSRKNRKDLYDRRREYFLHGTTSDNEVMYNRIESHIDLVSAFLYSPEHAEFSLSAPLNSDDGAVRQFLAAQDHYNRQFSDAGMFDYFGDALMWSIVFDTVMLKMGWNDSAGELSCTMIEPWKFGVFSEEITDFESQPAFVHTYHIDYDNAVQRLMRAGLAHRIGDLQVVNTPYESPFPELITRMIIASTSGSNLGGNVTGSVNPTYIARPSYHAEIDRPLVEFNELTVWDDECSDYRVFFMVAPGVVLSDSKATIKVLKDAKEFKAQHAQQEQFYNTACNPFMPKDTPYVHIRPYQIYDYFWGKAHIESLIPLQDWSNERLVQIHDILDRQAYPPRIGSGFMGLTDEKMEAFGGADSWVYDQLPQAAIKELYPEMPPDIFSDYSQIGALFLEASGLTEILQGKGTEGVRSRGHAKELKTTGGGRIKKTARRLEAPLVRMGDLGLKLMMRNSDDEITPDPTEDGKPGDPFYYHNLAGDYSLTVSGHSHSPLFNDESKEMAALLFKAQAIDQEALLRLLNPPNRNNLIHAWRVRQKKMAQERAMRAQMGGGQPAPHGRKPNGHATPP